VNAFLAASDELARVALLLLFLAWSLYLIGSEVVYLAAWYWHAVMG